MDRGVATVWPGADARHAVARMKRERDEALRPASRAARPAGGVARDGRLGLERLFDRVVDTDKRPPHPLGQGSSRRSAAAVSPRSAASTSHHRAEGLCACSAKMAVPAGARPAAPRRDLRTRLGEDARAADAGDPARQRDRAPPRLRARDPVPRQIFRGSGLAARTATAARPAVAAGPSGGRRGASMTCTGDTAATALAGLVARIAQIINRLRSGLAERSADAPA